MQGKQTNFQIMILYALFHKNRYFFVSIQGLSTKINKELKKNIIEEKEEDSQVEHVRVFVYKTTPTS